MFSDQAIHRTALTTSLILHALLFVIPFLDKGVELQQRQQNPIPVDFKMKEIVIKKKAPPKVVKKVKPTPKKVVPSKAKQETKKKLLPGDRKKAELVSSIIPLYPKEAINFEWEGTVTVLATIDENGKLIDTKILKSSGHAELDNSFLEALYKGYVFQPKKMYGEGLKDTVKVSYRFKL